MGNEIISRTSIWKGLNRAPYIEDGEMRDMKNLSSDAFPYLTTRKGRSEYQIEVFVPGVPGNGYLKDVEGLPAATEEDQGKIIKLIKLPEETPLEIGAFYYFEDAQWKKYENAVVEITEKVDTTKYKNKEYKDINYVPEGKKYDGKLIKYIGESDNNFKFGKTYKYTYHIEQYWKEVSYSVATEGTKKGPCYSEEDVKALENDPNYSNAGRGWYFRYLGETTDKFTYKKYYRNYYSGWLKWIETEEEYVPVKDITTAPTNKPIRYLGNLSGENVPKKYYTCEKEASYSNNETTTYYYYVPKDGFKGEFISQIMLPEASEENFRKTYYAGTELSFYICVLTEEGYKWEPTDQPFIPKKVNFAEYIREFQNAEVSQIHEIGSLDGKIAVLFEDGEGNELLYYEQQIFSVSNFTNTPGKKLQTVGNRLIVGESGSFLYYKKNESNENGNSEITYELDYHDQPLTICKTIVAESEYTGNGGTRAYPSIIESNKGDKKMYFKIVYPANSKPLQEVYDGIGKIGTGFQVDFDKKTYYLRTAESEYVAKKRIGGYSVGGDTYDQYASILELTASGNVEDYYWNSSEARPDYKKITITSTDPHYMDVVAWKKRLWGYNRNYVQGTAQDIFTKDDFIDWTTGDNTYTEAISQPIWQGGNITGLAALSDALILFKEDNLTVMTGNYPAIMQGSTIPCRGLSAENRESVAVANEAVYYMSYDGVYRFGGGLPQCISKNAKIKGTNAIGASNGRKYWVSIMENDKDVLYVYDIDLGIWHKEDDVAAVSFTVINGLMYMATSTQIFCIEDKQEDVSWEMELWYDEGTFNLKKYKGFQIRGDVGECEVLLKADDGEWQAYAFAEKKLSLKTEPFMCRELSVKIKGKGICKIKSLDRTYEIID